MSADQPSEDTPSRLLVGVLRVEPPIGWLPTVGMRIGEIKVSSRSDVATTSAELRDRLSLVSPSLNDRASSTSSLKINITGKMTFIWDA